MFQIFENLFSDPNHFQVLALFRKHFFLCFLLKDFKKCVLPYVISKLKSEIFHRKGIKFQQKKDMATTARGYRRDKRRGAVEWLFWKNIRFICFLKLQLVNLFVFFFICQAIYIFLSYNFSVLKSFQGFQLNLINQNAKTSKCFK